LAAKTFKEKSIERILEESALLVDLRILTSRRVNGDLMFTVDQVNFLSDEELSDAREWVFYLIHPPKMTTRKLEDAHQK